MIDIHNKLKYRNIKTLYNIKEILADGSIIVENKRIKIYKVEPINIINSDKEFRIKIFSTYLACIKNIKDIQIVIKTEKKNFNEQITFYRQRLMQIDSEPLKQAIEKYMGYLEKQDSVENFVKRIYIVETSSEMIKDVEMDIFTNTLSEIGVKVKKIEDIQEIRGVLRAFMVKEQNEAV